MRIKPKVVEAGHHRRELKALTGLTVEDGQVRKLLNDLAAFTAANGLGDEEAVCGGDPLADHGVRAMVALLPPEHGEKLSPAEYFHEVMGASLVTVRAGRPRGRHLRRRGGLHQHRAARPSPDSAVSLW